MRTKRMSLYIASVILLLIMIVGTLGVAAWALFRTKLDVSGNIGFQGSGDILATISNGTIDDKAHTSGVMDGFTIDVDSTGNEAERGTWTGLDLNFAPSKRELVIKFSVTNNQPVGGKNLAVTIDAVTPPASDIDMAVTTAELGTNPVVLAPVAIANYRIAFTVDETINRILRGSFSLVVNLVNTDATATVASSLDKLHFTLNSDSSSYSVRAANTSITGPVVIPTKYDKPEDSYGLLPVTIIEDSAFNGCAGITSIAVQKGVTTAGEYAFQNCTSLTSIDLPQSIRSLKKFAFNGCAQLTSVNLPEGITTIWDSTFKGCTNLTSVNIPSSVTQIDNRIFQGCSSLSSVTIPSGVTVIGANAFENCSSLPSITIPSGVTLVYNYTFHNCTSLTSVELQGDITTIGDYAFNGCTSLNSIDFQGNVTTIGNYSFQNCTNLTSITIPASVTQIGAYAFDGCPISAVNIPSEVTLIGSYAFRNCPITEINIPGKVETIGGGAFEGCANLTKVVIDSATIASSLTDVNKAGSVLANATEVYIKDTITTVGSYVTLKYRKESNASGYDKYVIANYLMKDEEKGYYYIELGSYNGVNLRWKLISNSQDGSFSEKYTFDAANVPTGYGYFVLETFAAPLLSDSRNFGETNQYKTSNVRTYLTNQGEGGIYRDLNISTTDSKYQRILGTQLPDVSVTDYDKIWAMPYQTAYGFLSDETWAHNYFTRTAYNDEVRTALGLPVYTNPSEYVVCKGGAGSACVANSKTATDFAIRPAFFFQITV